MKTWRQERPYNCPVEITLDIIGGRWKSLVLYHLLEGKQRFGSLKRLMPGVTQRMLTLQLRELEQDGVIQRVVYREVPPKVEYSLTDFGQSLGPILRQMYDWGTEYEGKIKELKLAQQTAFTETASNDPSISTVQP